MEAAKRPSSRRNQKPKNEWLTVLFFYLLPFVVINTLLFFCVTAKPKFTLTIGDTNDYLTTELTLRLDSWFPTKSVVLTLNGEELALEKKKNTYTVTVTKNGTVEAIVTNRNGMLQNAFEQVSILDDNPPTIENPIIEDGTVTVTIADSQSGVDFDSIYALDSSEQTVEALTKDRNTNTVSYPMDANGLRIFAKDRAGNEVQGTFSSRKEGSE